MINLYIILTEFMKITQYKRIKIDFKWNCVWGGSENILSWLGGGREAIHIFSRVFYIEKKK